MPKHILRIDDDALLVQSLAYTPRQRSMCTFVGCAKKFKVTRRKGTGLSIACDIVNPHGGRIEAESEVGKGSQFTVVLPS